MSQEATPEKRFRYFDLIMAAFVTTLLCSNLIGAAKVCEIHGISFGGAVLFFPISYLFGDVLTEVYGYRRSRRVIWTGFAALAFASLVGVVVINLPAAPSWEGQEALVTVFAQTPRIVAASLVAYFVGELMNSYSLAKIKIWSKGRWLWFRTIASTVLGEAVDSIIFYPLAFMFVWSHELVLKVMVTNYILKVLWEVLMTPATIKLVNFLKKVEQEDYYDYDTNFTPFSIRT